MKHNHGIDRNVNVSPAPRDDNRESFEWLFKTYYSPLCDYAYAILGDFDEAEDVVQDLFTRLLHDQKEIAAPASMKSYLYASTRHRALNVLKHKAVMKRNNSLLVEFIENLQQEGYSKEEELQIEKISRVLESLPSRCRAVFTLSCLEGKRYKEIAAEMGISVNTVKFHVKRAYKEIHAAIDSAASPLLLLLTIKNRLYPLSAYRR
ncbi:MAG: RNA polymerase sigma-70 factor [Odoribacteraceae bacterium]|jgi:RNA polymerase sigma-70 factor (ECF subfamily)|nr:RNA polymerase sigma-70 factor [Odoribacteraceae bacterium]